METTRMDAGKAAVVAFLYPPVPSAEDNAAAASPGWTPENFVAAGESGAGEAGLSGAAPDEAVQGAGARVQELERRLEEQAAAHAAELAALNEEAFARGLAEGRRRQEQEARRAALPFSAAAAAFAEARQGYFEGLERETARLALAIAARILRREAHMDPLLLAGAVRVALGQLRETSTVRLRVAAATAALWKETMTLMPGLPIRPEVVADEALAADAAEIECELGTLDLGVREQLDEVERGFFDQPEIARASAPPRLTAAAVAS